MNQAFSKDYQPQGEPSIQELPASDGVNFTFDKAMELLRALKGHAHALNAQVMNRRKGQCTGIAAWGGETSYLNIDQVLNAIAQAEKDIATAKAALAEMDQPLPALHVATLNEVLRRHSIESISRLKRGWDMPPPSTKPTWEDLAELNKPIWPQMKIVDEPGFWESIKRLFCRT